MGELVADDLRPNQAGKTRNPGCIEPQYAGTLRDIPLPADPDQRKALLEEQRVCQVFRRARVGLAAEIKHPEHPPATAVGNLKKRGPVSYGRIDRLQHI